MTYSKKPHEPTFKDGTATCVAVGNLVTLRCDIHGIITCRGPDNTKHYYRKCKAKTDMPKCALTKAANTMRAVKIKASNAKKRAVLRLLKQARKESRKGQR